MSENQYFKDLWKLKSFKAASLFVALLLATILISLPMWQRAAYAPQSQSLTVNLPKEAQDGKAKYPVTTIALESLLDEYAKHGGQLSAAKQIQNWVSDGQRAVEVTYTLIRADRLPQVLRSVAQIEIPTSLGEDWKPVRNTLNPNRQALDIEYAYNSTYEEREWVVASAILCATIFLCLLYAIYDTFSAVRRKRMEE